jgi:hypothetical protein
MRDVPVCAVGVAVVREDMMRSNLKEFRRSALQCADMAQRAATPALAALLVELSKNWMKLA